MTGTNRPRVSVVIEGYNESLSLGSVTDTLDGVAQQDFPLHQVEVILVGSAAQAQAWEQAYASGTPFFRVKAISLPGAHYYALKNEGARAAAADIIVLTDSDVHPQAGWLSSIVAAIDHGADVAAGVTLFCDERGRGPDHPLMQVAASISWGFVIPTVLDERTVIAGGFLSHNVGFRAETFRRHQYRTDLGRTCAGSFLYQALRESGATMWCQPDQRVAHAFSPRWWVLRLHRRFGYEVFRLRRLDTSAASPWLSAITLLEPVLTMGWHVLLNVPQWLRFSRVLRLPRWRRLLLLPMVVAMSVLARGGEMVGMYQTMAMPQAMKRFAESKLRPRAAATREPARLAL